MATKEFIIKVEEGNTECKDCPFRRTSNKCYMLECNHLNLATMKITKYNEGEALLYAVNKTAERTKREVINKAVEWIKSQMYIENIFEYDKDNQPVRYVCASCCDTVDDFIEKFKQAMEDEV